MILKSTIAWFIQTMKIINPEVFHLINRKKKVNYPYITFTDVTSPQDEIRDEHRLELNLFDYGTSRAGLMDLEQGIKDLFDRQIFREKDAIYQTRLGLSNDIPTGDNTIQRRDIELIIKQDRREI